MNKLIVFPDKNSTHKEDTREKKNASLKTWTGTETGVILVSRVNWLSCHALPWYRKPLEAYSGRDVAEVRCPKVAFLQFPPGYFFPSSFQEKEKELLLQSDHFSSCFSIPKHQVGGSTVHQWLGRRTWNPQVAGLSPALTTKVELFLSRP